MLLSLCRSVGPTAQIDVLLHLLDDITITHHAVPSKVHFNVGLIKQHPCTILHQRPTAPDVLLRRAPQGTIKEEHSYHCHLFCVVQNFCRYNQLELLIQGTKLMIESRRLLGRVSEEGINALIRGFHVTSVTHSFPNAVNSG